MAVFFVKKVSGVTTKYIEKIVLRRSCICRKACLTAKHNRKECLTAKLKMQRKVSNVKAQYIKKRMSDGEAQYIRKRVSELIKKECLTSKLNIHGKNV